MKNKASPLHLYSWNHNKEKKIVNRREEKNMSNHGSIRYNPDLISFYRGMQYQVFWTSKLLSKNIKIYVIKKSWTSDLFKLCLVLSHKGQQISEATQYCSRRAPANKRKLGQVGKSQNQFMVSSILQFF